MVQGWGRTHKYCHNTQAPGYLSEMSFSAKPDVVTTLHGQGRSYGDIALNDGGCVVTTENLNRLIAADWTTGLMRCEAGMTLDQVLRIAVPRGWFLSVTPGTKFVSLGGAVANDVHGKNHHEVGSFGNCVTALGLKRSDGERLCLSRNENTDLFSLTISGLGLTGFIEWVELQLIPIRSPLMYVENFRYGSLEEFFELSDQSDDWPYTVSWVDCFASGKALGRGIFTRARHDQTHTALIPHGDSKLSFPMDAPGWLLNRATITAFNALYRARPGAFFKGKQPYGAFFYPLDGIKHWNRMYGKRGFYQHQSLIPPEHAAQAMRELLNTIRSSGQGSFLAVMKNHGPELSPGRNSFCFEGTSLALDFANKGAKTVDLVAALDAIVMRCEGRIYPAKDGLMSAQTYKRGFPHWQELEAMRDPALNSAFWQRVIGSDA